jgi:hypothetical protein
MALNKILERFIEICENSNHSLDITLGKDHRLILEKGHYPFVVCSDTSSNIVYKPTHIQMAKRFKKFVRTHPHLFKEIDFKIEEAILDAL